jgi:hypothetical protein
MSRVGWQRRRAVPWAFLATSFGAEVVIFASFNFSRECGESFAPHWAIPALAAPFLLAVGGLGAAAVVRGIPEVFGAAALICGCALLLLAVALGGLGDAC